MIKKAKSFLANHPRMRIVAILGGAISIFSVAMHVVNHKQADKKPQTPASFVTTQKVDLKNKLPESFDHKKMLTKLSKQKDADIRNNKIHRGATIIPGGWFDTHTDSIVTNAKNTNAKNKAGKTITKSPAKTIAKNNTDTAGQNKNQALANNTNGVIKDTSKKVMSPDEFVKAMKAQEANIHTAPDNNPIANNHDNSHNNPYNNSNNNSYNNNHNLRDFSQKRLEGDNQRPLTQEQRMREQNKKQEINRVAGGLKAELDSATQNSEDMPTPSFEDINQSAYVNTAKEAAKAKATAKKAKDSQIIIKAGTIFYATTTNMVSSDQANTPVLAQMINGPYRGAKLIGSFNTEGEKLVMQFNTMIMKNRKRSFSIGTAYAIDTKDGQLAVQTAVNHHYLKRYGALLASSFLKGLGEAVTPVDGIGGSSTYCSGITNPITGVCNGKTITTYDNGNPNSVTTKNMLLRGAGEIGSKLSDNVGQIFNTPITVKVAQGTLVGILFTQDTVIPAIDNGGAQDDPDYASSDNNQGTLDFLKDND